MGRGHRGATSGCRRATGARPPPTAGPAARDQSPPGRATGAGDGTGQLLEVEGDGVAAVEELRPELVRHSASGDFVDELAGRTVRQGLKVHHVDDVSLLEFLAEFDDATRCLVPCTHHEEDGRRRCTGKEESDQLDRCRIGPVKILYHDTARMVLRPGGRATPPTPRAAEPVGGPARLGDRPRRGGSRPRSVAMRAGAAGISTWPNAA